jgi:hypothetical protein
MDYDAHKDGFIVTSAHQLRLRVRKIVPLPNSSSPQDERIIITNDDSLTQSEELSSRK